MSALCWVVEKIVDGHHGPYAVTRDQKLGFVTFALDKEVWKDEGIPSPGSEVVLEDFRKRNGAWRAMSARFFRPKDIISNEVGRKKQ